MTIKWRPAHVDSDKSLFPRWSVRSGLDPAIKKDKCKCQS